LPALVLAATMLDELRRSTSWAAVVVALPGFFVVSACSSVASPRLLADERDDQADEPTNAHSRRSEDEHLSLRRRCAAIAIATSSSAAAEACGRRARRCARVG